MTKTATRMACSVRIASLPSMFEPRIPRDLLVEASSGRVALSHVPLDWRIRSAHVDVNTAEPVSLFQIELPDRSGEAGADGSAVVTIHEFDVAAKLAAFGGTTLRIEERNDDVLLEGGGMKWSATKGLPPERPALHPVLMDEAETIYKFSNGSWVRRCMDALHTVAEAVAPRSIADDTDLVSAIQVHGKKGSRCIRIGAADQFAFAGIVQASGPDDEAVTGRLPEEIGPVLVCPMEAAAFTRSMAKYDFYTEPRLTILCADDRVTFRAETSHRGIVRSLTAKRGSIPQINARHGDHRATSEVVCVSRHTLLRLAKTFPSLRIDATGQEVVASDGDGVTGEKVMQARLSRRAADKPDARPVVIDSDKLARCLKMCRKESTVRLGLPAKKSDPLTISCFSDLWHADVFCAVMPLSVPELDLQAR